jgi:mono/diheme cytochrome c family protein
MRVSLAIPLAFFPVPFLSAALEIDFQRDIQPIFAEHCLECHGPDKAKGGLTLTTREAVLKELESGSHGVVPGNVAESELITRLITTEADDVMPPKKKTKRPSAREIDLLKKWVATGAEWTQHWAYRPIIRSAVPNRGNGAIDSFVLKTLAEKKVPPAPEADRLTLLKRLSYDLLGLPPKPEEIDSFVGDTAPDAYARLVERLLASPHFGERWGRHWLDQARYADSDGYEKDSARPDAWRYRDWVINAINRDQPFDQFTIEQLAGDLLPKPTPEQILATAFHRQTLTNREGGVDQEQYRIEAVFDRTETTGAVWLAHTVSCARCHTHKYDQLTHSEYYGMFAFFNNADEATAKVGTSPDALVEFEHKNAAHIAQLRTLQTKLAKAREPLAEKMLAWEKETTARLAALDGQKAQDKTAEIISVASQGDVPFQKLEDGSWLAGSASAGPDTYTLEVNLPAGVISALRLEALPDDSLPAKGPGWSDGGNFVLSEFAVKSASGEALEFHSPKADFSQKEWLVAGATDQRATTGWGISPQFGKAHQATFQLLRPMDAAQSPRVTVTLQHAYGKKHSLGRFRLVALVGETEESIVSADLKRLIATGSEKWTNEQREQVIEWLGHFDPVASEAAQELANAEASGAKPPVMDVRVLRQRPQPRQTHVLHRGEFLSPAAPVQPGTPAILPPIQARNGGTPDRLDLARWLVSREHPLTARVIVNQIWMRFFGEGIVRTVDDFGVRGEKPTHQELLDWLASEFVDRGWSRKEMIRLIVNSTTYRQRSEVRPELNELDPRNTLLARQNRLRVEGEIVRDLHLAAGGLLSPKIGGPSVFPPMPPEIASFSYAGNFRWNESKGDDRQRRGIYTFFKRTAPHPDLMVFDCPDANVASVRRTVSNTPLQALTTLNALTFSEAARALSHRVLTEASPNDEARLGHAFRLCLSRPPQPAETAALLSLVNDARSYYAAHEDDAKKISVGADKPGEVAAWATAARILLNTDEFITRD